MSSFDPHTPLAEVRLHVASKRRDGVRCPACDQQVKVYRRALNSGQAYAIVKMYQHHVARGWSAPFDSRDLITAGKRGDADFAKLRFWGLIKRLEGEACAGGAGPRRTARYLMTDLGRRFVEGRVSVPAAVYLYNDRKEGEATERITIQQAAGNRFDWQKLMGPHLTAADQLPLWGNK